MSRNSVCPWQVGRTLNTAPRRLLHNPQRILGKYISQSMTVMDVGCGMGYFTIPMAQMVGENGQVVAVDLQPKMLAGMLDRADNCRVGNVVTPVICNKDSLGIGNWEGKIAFALLFMMLHEVPDKQRVIRELHTALSPEGILLFSEPIIHVKQNEFMRSLRTIKQEGFDVLDTPSVPICRAVVLKKT